MRTKDQAKRLGTPGNLPDPPFGDSFSEEESREASDSQSSKSNKTRSGEVSDSASSKRNKSSSGQVSDLASSKSNRSSEAASEREAEEANPANEDAESQRSGEANEVPVGVMPPVGMYINKDQYPCSTKIATRCYITKAVIEIEKRLDKDELDWFRDHPQFRHFFHMPRDKTHKSMGMWMLILRIVRTEKKKEIWFLVK